ncbi:MAG TPA: hypothetical protein VEG44_09730 [Candidatus Acidoferrales bacterium]|nr:hypothetical protein [Candidatus Acidoferrales bacterium]
MVIVYKSAHVTGNWDKRDDALSREHPVISVGNGQRASAYGLFTASYGIFWFLGSGMIGILYSVSLPLLIAFCLITEFTALPLFLPVRRHTGHNSLI